MNLSDTDKQKLREAFSVKPTVNGNVMNFIGLDEIRARLPDMWEKHQERITATSLAILKQFTDSRTDIILPVGGSKFVVLFGRLDKDEAMLRAAMIKAEILRRFVGDDVLANLDVQIQAMEIDSGNITSGTLGDLLAPASPAEPSPAGRVAERTTARPPAAKPDKQQRVYRASMNELGAGAPLSIADIEKRFGFNIEDLEFAFQPHLYVKRNVFSIFECRAVRYSATDDILTGYGVLPRQTTSEQVAALDEMTLMRARHGLVDMAIRKRVAVVVAPVSFTTMTTRALSVEYLALLQKIPPDLRNYLAITVCHSPEGVPEGRLAEIVNPVKRLVRAVFVHVTSVRQPLTIVHRVGAFGAGISLPARPVGEFGSPAFLERFTATAHKLGLQTYANEIDTPEQAARCRAVGFDYIAGRALAELSDYVGPVTAPTVS